MKIISQFQLNRLKILMILTISIFLISLVVLIGIWEGIPFGNLTRDIIQITGFPPYTGFFSQIGIIFWIATSTLCIFSAKMGSKRQRVTGFKRFLYLSGLLTLFLGFDDIFLLHEYVLPYFGISEKVVFAIYGILVISFLVKFYSIILKTDYILLAMAFFFFGLSVFFDLFKIPGFNSYLIEDAPKMVGIVSWSFYFYSNALVAFSNQKE